MLLSAVLIATTYRSTQKYVARRRQQNLWIVNMFIFNELYVAESRQSNRALSGNHYRGEKWHKTKNPAEAGFKIGRRERIRTSDPLVPNQLRYQAALLADVLLFEFLVQFI